MSVIKIVDLEYSYDGKRKILNKINMEFEEGKVYAIIGPSGCGKTTLLSLIGGLEETSSGEIYFDNQEIKEYGLAKHRKNHVSFVFQNYNLIDYMNAIENVKLTAKCDAGTILEKMGLTKEETKRNVLKLSGGQQQRVAIARALASDTKVIFADEPTGNLDESMAKEIINILIEMAHKLKKCIIIVTHSNEIAKNVDVVYRLKRGMIQKIEKND